MGHETRVKYGKMYHEAGVDHPYIAEYLETLEAKNSKKKKGSK